MTIIKLPDGRRLSYAEYGDQHGKLVLFCHGIPGSRLQMTKDMAQTAHAMGLRLVVPDRPGYGLSDPKPGRKLLDWPQDVSVLINALGAEQFWVVGFSLGAAYSLACTWAMPERVTGVSLVGGIAPNMFDPQVISAMSPTNNAIFALGRDNPACLHDTLQTLAPDADTLFAALLESFSAPDKALLAQLQIASAYRRDSVETLCQGHDAASTDFILAVKDWNFDLEEIHAPVHVWNGEEDLNAPPAMAEYMATRLPHSRIHLLPGEGHLCLFSHWEEILGEICESGTQCCSPDAVQWNP